MKEVFIERREDILRIAVQNNGLLEECLIEEEDKGPYQGQIYKGIVKNIVPAIKCAFIDIGFDKNCYMYIDRKFNNTNIKKNDEVIVEILKESVGDKGPKATNAISIPGRYSVLETLNKRLDFSKKIEDAGFKEHILEHVKLPKDTGVMIRTNAQNVSSDEINKEIEKLYDVYCSIIKDAQYSIKPKLLYGGEGILDKILRDVMDSETEKLVVDSERDYDYIKEFLKNAADIDCKVELFNESITLFSYYGIEKEILKLRNNQVYLKSGGHIVIDRTEAMYVIDVNSGKNVKGTSIQKTAFITNLEAAKEIGRQIKLRNLAGIIVIDFIDMEGINEKEKVLEILRQAFKDDKSKTVVYTYTELNLVQIARRRRGRPIQEYIEEKCTECRGRGRRIRLNYLFDLIRNEVIRLENKLEAKNIYIELSKIYKAEILNNTNMFARAISCSNKSLYVNFVEDMDYFEIEPLIFPNHIENKQKFKIYG